MADATDGANAPVADATDTKQGADAPASTPDSRAADSSQTALNAQEREELVTLRKAKEDAAAAERQRKLDAAKDLEAYKAEAKTQLEELKASYAEDLAKRDKALNGMRINAYINEHFPNLTKEGKALLPDKIANDLSVNEEGVVGPKEGKVDKLQKQYQTDFPSLFASTRPGGSGVTPPDDNKSGANTMSLADWDALTVVQQNELNIKNPTLRIQ